MLRQPVSRSQRRLEKKQAVILLGLILAVSLVSFALGVLAGRGSVRPVAQTRQPVTYPLPAPPRAGGPAAEGGDNLTFYDALPKGEQSPLGSGINLPPKSTAPVAAEPVPPPPPQESVFAVAPESQARLASPSEPAPAARAETSTPAPVSTKASPLAPTVAKANAARVAAPAPVKTAPVPAATDGAFVVQAAAFREATDARGLQARLAGKGYAVYTQEANLGEKGVWYRVFVGPYPSASAAETAVRRLKAEEKLSAMVKKR